MRVVRGFRDLAMEHSASVVSIGNFDGVHRGHQAVINSAADDSRRRGLISVVCTFDPHTRIFLEPESPPRLLQTLDQRLAVFEGLGVDVAVVIPFNQEVASVAPETFVEGFLRDTLEAAALHVSDGFTFGRDGSGSVDYLRHVAPQHGFEVTVVPPVFDEQGAISSTRVRQLVLVGQVEAAARLLGRAPALIGTVVRGAGRGQGTAAPTANLDPENGCLPAPGVYVTEARLRGEGHRSVSNVGFRPTFGSSEQLTVEAHLLDYGGDLYGERLELAFLKRLRDEIAFDSVDSLAAQIRQDVERAEAHFRSVSG
ncbi:MAG: bifunctional riboflavin kinase/FAD synthetase [Acidobacteriota bacterium]